MSAKRFSIFLAFCLLFWVPTTWAATIVHTARFAAVNAGTDNDFFNAVAYGNGLYAAAGTDGVIYSSTDGTHWTARQGGIGLGGQYTDLIYAGGLFVAVGEDVNGFTHASHSADGVTWTDAMVTLPASALADGIGYGAGTYVLADTVSASSPDGVTWTEHDIVPAGTGDQFVAPVFANGTFVTLGFGTSNNPLLYVSKDNGATWSSGFSFATTDDPQILVSNGSSFVLLGQDNACNCGLVLTSADGLTWQRKSNASADVGQYFIGQGCKNDTTFFSSPVVWDGSKFQTYTYSCFNPGSGQAASYAAFNSPDGVTWSAGATRSVTGEPDNEAFFSNHAVVATPTGFLATSDDALTLDSSPDFANWTVAASLAPPPAPMSSGGYGMPGWLVLGILAGVALLRRHGLRA